MDMPMNSHRTGERMVEIVDTDKDIFDSNDNKIGYWRKLEDGANGDNLYEVYFDESKEDKGDYLQSQEFVSDDENAEKEAYDYAKSVI